ncbi:YjgN family protein [Hydrogenophaga sp. 5NK40-0174]|uniref:YjgN family protein n=1 Tax=Hydrogenophaga sp. 5NK40-0174 TaxID=3127649 RepID=UPI00310C42B4
MAESNDFAPTEIHDNSSATTVPLQPKRLDIKFTGSGSEYFRIWIVNLLLTLITLTLYIPFARARRMTYFQANTLIDGDSLGFHANPWRMFWGYLIVLVLGVTYSVVSNFYPEFNLAAIAVFAIVWPALWRASLRFRLRNTSWRGVRLAFLGDVKSAYIAMLPFFVPALVIVLVMPTNPETADPKKVMQGMGIFGLVMIAFVFMLPWIMTRLKRYQHGGYSFAQERTELTATTGSFYLLWGKLFLLSMGVSIVVAIIAAVIMLAVGVLGVASGGIEDSMGAAMGAIIGLVSLVYIVIPLITGTYFQSRMQNLLWNNTRSPRLTFLSDLEFKPLFKVTLKNWLLTAITLGLYWPWARVNLTKVKLEAMAIEVEGNVDQWVARAQSEAGPVGDAAGDFFDIDIGF